MFTENKMGRRLRYASFMVNLVRAKWTKNIEVIRGERSKKLFFAFIGKSNSNSKYTAKNR